MIYIGDTAHDRACAAAAGVSFALAGWNPRARSAAEPGDVILDEPHEVLDLFVTTRDPPGGSEGFHPWPAGRRTGRVTPCCSPEPSSVPTELIVAILAALLLVAVLVISTGGLLAWLLCRERKAFWLGSLAFALGCGAPRPAISGPGVVGDRRRYAASTLIGMGIRSTSN